ncbi:5-oxoprolinase subunit PxpA [Corynebacterium crudilactis]|uniref:5-oxoprolinase subunit A n=1 Tax=Corynebacterium crudilactis TaxID=1652495 RepID=A0A172QSE4_9CORY|nr:5-oxoprolinase subunit PxpA [Corynebacterium crudilactis]ANE03623.1 hypothetical protein ccrud_04935 [Corynebacterium crudilactis]
MTTIDLNSDLGESYGNWIMGNDEAVLDLVSSANIACGFHAGDATVLLKTVRAAHARGVRIGAHIGYNDIAGFGRRNIDYAHDDLVAETIYQIGAIKAAATASGATVDYVKPHGALYNTIAVNEAQAAAVIEGILLVDPSLTLMALAGSQIVAQARVAGLQVEQETFADRAYTADGQLVSRKLPGAVHHDPQTAATQALAFATGRPITAITGESVLVDADSICVHGDNPQALALVQKIVSSLSAHDVQVSYAH